MTDRWIRRILPPGRLGATIGTTGSCPPRTADCLSDAPVPYAGEGGYSITPLTGANTWPCLDSPGEVVPGGGGYGYQGPQGPEGGSGGGALCPDDNCVLDVYNSVELEVSSDLLVVVPLDEAATDSTPLAPDPPFEFDPDNNQVVFSCEPPETFDVEFRVLAEHVLGDAIDEVKAYLYKNGAEIARGVATGFLLDGDSRQITINGRVSDAFGGGDTLQLFVSGVGGVGYTVGAYGASLTVVMPKCPRGMTGLQGAQGAARVGYQGYQGAGGGEFGTLSCPGGISHTLSVLGSYELANKVLTFQKHELVFTSGCLATVADDGFVSFDICPPCTVETPCCPDRPISRTLTVTFANGDGPYTGLNGQSYTLTWDETESKWVNFDVFLVDACEGYPECSPLGGNLGTCRFYCDSPDWKLELNGCASFTSPHDEEVCTETEFVVSGTAAGPCSVAYYVDWQVTEA